MTTDETVADYDVGSPARRTLVTVIGTLLAVALLAGLVLGGSILMRSTRVATSVIDLGTSAQLVISATSADIRIVQGGKADSVKLISQVTSGLRKTQYEIGRRGDEIKVLSSCQDWLSPGCGVALTLEVPEGLPVVVSTTTGNIEADTVTQGVLTVSTTSGDISADELTVDEFSSSSRSGSIRAGFAAQPFAFKAVTDSGNVAATIPAGKRRYAVTVASKSGNVSSSIDSDTDGDGFVRATSGSGDIAIRTG